MDVSPGKSQTQLFFPLGLNKDFLFGNSDAKLIAKYFTIDEHFVLHFSNVEKLNTIWGANEMEGIYL